MSKGKIWIKVARALVDVFLVSLALYCAYMIRFDFSIEPAYWRQFVNLLPVVVLIQVTSLYYFGGYRFIWRYASIDDLVDILKAIGCGMALLAIVNYFRNYPLAVALSIGFSSSSLFHRGYLHLLRSGRSQTVLVAVIFLTSAMLLAGGLGAFMILSSAPTTIGEFPLGLFLTSQDFQDDLSMPRSVPILSGILALMFIGGIRMIPRLVTQVGSDSNKRGRRVLIYGAGDIGEGLVRAMRSQTMGEFQPVGFIDDDPAKQGATIHGIKVLGSRRDLSSVVDLQIVEELLLATLSIDDGRLKQIAAICDNSGIRLRRVPPLAQLISSHVDLTSLEQVDTEELLGRSEVQLDPDKVDGYLRGKVVMVTGAGGSIGSELCRQISRSEPKLLLLLGKGENSIYHIQNELTSAYSDVGTAIIIGDVCDPYKMDYVFREFRPDVVFHAAAYKHVPLMEASPEEAVRNNVFGTHLLATTALRFGTKKFVLVSTDKAVYPSSVMGATKKLAECVLQRLGGEGETQFVTVRFGNVLRSRGSVIPLFEKQIKAGGPVTVTHPEMRRFFMSIPEAVRLVLHSGAIGTSGDLCVLDMGVPMRILDLAENMIRLANNRPCSGIEIVFTGLRPGEKLNEKLLTDAEVSTMRKVGKILICRAEEGDWSQLDSDLAMLRTATKHCRRSEIVSLLEQIVPGYEPYEQRPESSLRSAIYSQPEDSETN